MLSAWINGNPYNTLYDFSVTEQAGNKTSSTISVEVGAGQVPPVSGDIIELKDTDSDTVLFWGTCGIPQSPKYKTGLEKHIYKIKCGNANSILSNRIINVAFQNQTVNTIVQNLFTQYISAEGITLGGISEISVTMDVYTAKDYNLQSALNELADLVGAVWMIDNNKQFYFVVYEDFPQFPQTISQDFLLGAEYQHTTKDYKTRTVQYISGATDVTSTQTEAYTYDGEQTAFSLVFPVSSKPAITVNGTAVDPQLIGVNGLNDEDPNIVFLFSYNSQAIRYVQSTDYLTTGDLVGFSYIGIFPIRVAVSNVAKIEEIAQKTGTSGRREMVQLASNITTQADALQLAQSLLQQFESYTEEVKFWLTSDQLAQLGVPFTATNLLTQVEIDLPQIGIVGSYVISERTIEPFYADMTDPYGKLKISLRLMNRDYMRSYAETISDLRQDIKQLSVRADDVVVNAEAIAETLKLSESWVVAVASPYYPQQSPSSYPLFVPSSLGAGVYPV